MNDSFVPAAGQTNVTILILFIIFIFILLLLIIISMVPPLSIIKSIQLLEYVIPPAAPPPPKSPLCYGVSHFMVLAVLWC